MKYSIINVNKSGIKLKIGSIALILRCFKEKVSSINRTTVVLLILAYPQSKLILVV
jgi:hypothetical protein